MRVIQSKFTKTTSPNFSNRGGGGPCIPLWLPHLPVKAWFYILAHPLYQQPLFAISFGGSSHEVSLQLSMVVMTTCIAVLIRNPNVQQAL